MSHCRNSTLNDAKKALTIIKPICYPALDNFINTRLDLWKLADFKAESAIAILVIFTGLSSVKSNG